MRRADDVGFPTLVKASVLARPNRFLIEASLGGSRVRAACRDPGRLEWLVRPGADVLLAPARGPGRATTHTLVLVRSGRLWVSALPALANDLLAAAVARGGLPDLPGARVLRREVRRGASRFDFLLAWRGAEVLVEVKSCTRVRGGRALFPDAPTVRGVRHVRELIEHRRRGGRSLLVFVAQRGDAESIAPFRERDPEFGRALDEAARAGVLLRAYRCRVRRSGVRLEQPIHVAL